MTVAFHVFLLCLQPFNSHPHKEDDNAVKSFYYSRNLSTHILTRRMTIHHVYLVMFHRSFNSHPHKEDDFHIIELAFIVHLSTHILTRRMTQNP